MAPAPGHRGCEGGDHGVAEFLRAVVDAQCQRGCDVEPQGFAPGGEALEQRGGRRHRKAETVAGTRPIVLGRGRHEPCDRSGLSTRRTVLCWSSGRKTSPYRQPPLQVTMSNIIILSYTFWL